MKNVVRSTIILDKIFFLLFYDSLYIPCKVQTFFSLGNWQPQVLKTRYFIRTQRVYKPMYNWISLLLKKCIPTCTQAWTLRRIPRRLMLLTKIGSRIRILLHTAKEVRKNIYTPPSFCKPVKEFCFYSPCVFFRIRYEQDHFPSQAE